MKSIIRIFKHKISFGMIIPCILIIGFTMLNTSLSAQVSINTTGNAPDGSAMLDVVSSNKGVLMPRVALTGTSSASPVTSPAAGLMVYNTATTGDVTPGYYWWDSSEWIRFGSGGGCTLDQAYDFGGAGAGRTITADNGNVVINGTGTVTADQGRLHVTTVGGTGGTPSAAISGTIGTASSVGFGLSGIVTNSDNPGAGIYAESNGTGQTISANMTGTGTCGFFDINNGSNIYHAISATTNGSGNAVLARTSGTGRAGEFANTNSSNSSDVVYFESNNRNANIINVYNSASYGTGTGHGIRARITQSVGCGVMAGNLHATGTGISGYGNGVSPYTPSLGCGGAFTSSNMGVFGASSTTNSGTGGGMFWLGTSGTYWSFVSYNDVGTFYGFISNGAKSTVVQGLEEEERIMFCTESPEVLFEDYGEGQLVNGSVHIEIDPILSKNICVNEKHPLRVFIQLEGNCNGVYVTNKTSTGFDVVELNNGTSNTRFVYHIIGNRVDRTDESGKILSKYEDLRFPKGPVPQETISLGDKNESVKQNGNLQEDNGSRNSIERSNLSKTQKPIIYNNEASIIKATSKRINIEE